MHIWKSFLSFSTKTCVVGTQKEQSQWYGSFEHTKHMFKLMGKKRLTILPLKYLLLLFLIGSISLSITTDDFIVFSFEKGVYRQNSEAIWSGSTIFKTSCMMILNVSYVCIFQKRIQQFVRSKTSTDQSDGKAYQELLSKIPLETTT